MSNSREAQIERYALAAKRAGLTVYEISIEPKRVRIFTQPLAEETKQADAATEWLARNGPNKAPRSA